MKLAHLLSLILLASATIYFSEEFDKTWTSRWHQSSIEGLASFELSSGEWYVDEKQDQGILTSKGQYHQYAISAKFPSFTNEGKPFVLQYTVKNQDLIECGGSYVKVYPEGFDQENLSKDTPFLVMFGPDQCGGPEKTLVLLPYKGKNYINKSTIKAESDKLTHQYTLVLNPDNTFKVLIDNSEVVAGDIEDHFEMMPPQEIDDPEAKKPEDWDDREKIPDVNDVKPEGWDSVPEFVVDNEAEKPEDWDDEEDGVWKAPKVRNPEYKGKWKQRTVANPDYSGVWVPPKVKNPEYQPGVDLYVVPKAGGVGIEIMQIRPNSIFDNFFIGDSEEEALEFSKKTFKNRQEKEPEMIKDLQGDNEDDEFEGDDLGREDL